MASYIEVFSTVGYKMVESVGNPANAHHGYQIFYVLEGDAVFSVAGKKYRLSKNDCIIVPPFAEHYYVSGANREPIIFDIQFTVRDKAFDKQIRNICVKILPAKDSAQVLLKQIVEQARRRSEHSYDFIRDITEAFVLALIDQSRPADVAAEDALGVDFGTLSECTKRVTRYLEGMVTGSHKFDLDHVATVVGYSKKYLCNTFIHEVGMTIKQYLMRLRLEKAKELIDNTDYTIKEISEILNFGSYVYFVRSFKTYEGKTPIEYRNENSRSGKYLRYSFRDGFDPDPGPDRFTAGRE